jgi:hypothetical protein
MRKTICRDNYYSKELDLKIEQEKNKGRMLDLKIAAIKQSRINKLCINTNNTNNITTTVIKNQNNITNITINKYRHEYNKPKSQIDDMIVSNDLIQTIQNLFKNQYNNTSIPENQCIQIKDNKIFACINTPTGLKQLGYAEIKPHIKQHIKSQVDDILQEHKKISDDDIIMYNIQQKDFINDNKIIMIGKIPSYVNNERNNGIVKKQLKIALV